MGPRPPLMLDIDGPGIIESVRLNLEVVRHLRQSYGLIDWSRYSYIVDGAPLGHFE